jgi:multicomponent Na+:H+ antiporter subunit D
MIEPVPPAFLFFGGALLLVLLRRARFFREAILVLVPLAAFANLLQMSPGTYWTYPFLGYELVLGRVDKLSLVFGYIFVIISFLGFLYALHVREDGQHVAAFLYVGSSLGVVFAGDLFTVFIFWEIMALSSVFLIWYRAEKSALNAGFRYLLVHLFGGALLLTGIVLQASQTGTTVFQAMSLDSPSSVFILLGFMLNAAVPPLNAWLPDAYPEGTVTGSVFLSAFTTKAGVYVLARGFAGAEILMWMGAIMAVYGVIYAFIENDIRRLLSYHIISQVGYMVCGVGLGSPMAVNGSSAHAFCHILYKALLFMGAGAVIHVTGRRKITELMGRDLYRAMPWTLLFYMVGAFSISGVPLFNGFISKNMVVYAAGELHRPGVELLLHLASVGTFLSVGLKLPWGTWFGKKTEHGDRIAAHEPPFNMLLAMGLTSFLCLLTGIAPGLLYAVLPYPVDFHPYTPDKVVFALQLLLMTGAAFWFYLPRLKVEKAISLDTDWFYRMFGKGVAWFCNRPLNAFRSGVQDEIRRGVDWVTHWGGNPYRVPKLLLLLVRGERVGGKKYREFLHEQYRENAYRLPIGLAVGTSAFFLFLFGLIYMLVWG